LVAVLFLAGVSRRQTQPWLLTGWAWFFVMLLPVIGVVQVGLQSMADRYAYLPSIGLFLAVVWGLADVAARSFAWPSITGAAPPHDEPAPEAHRAIAHVLEARPLPGAHLPADREARVEARDARAEEPSDPEPVGPPGDQAGEREHDPGVPPPPRVPKARVRDPELEARDHRPRPHHAGHLRQAAPEVGEVASAEADRGGIEEIVLEGQLEGSVHMGLGFALTESLVVKDGRIQNGTLRKLGVLRSTDMPEVEIIFVEAPMPDGPYGAKGVGEIGLVPTAGAVANALYRFDGKRRTTLPMKDSPAAKALSVGR